ncbi:MAG: GlsB/YeaQ/YmgE family stress response membrane protein [Actinobacteria bacterium]|nr:GlsB/YeaQ/YmgE family stress response membrane protein [Actinomycetota bacterium]
MSILGWIVIGFFAGWLAGIATGTKDRYGCLLNPVVGILGAFVGGLIFSYIRNEKVTFAFDWWSLFVAFVGACALLLAVKLLAWAFSGRGGRRGGRA